MSEVLYRKWRPNHLTDVVGQEHVTRILEAAISTGRIAHAYLFCGPRGTGKTSTARILAKALNCMSPIEGDPDNECAVCLAINEGRSLDLVEIDGASNRRINDIRDLSEKIHYGPTEGKYKVYIIDEVHMLTTEAFNALLKTLEEPPDHAIIILATTDIHKVPLTIISRCQRFDFRRIPIAAIKEKLTRLCVSEGVKVDPEALEFIARRSGGSLRDSENLLDQAIVTFEEPITLSDLNDLFNVVDQSLPLQLLESISKKDVINSVEVLGRFVENGGDIRQMHGALIDLLRTLVLIKSDAINSDEDGEEVDSRLRLMASGFDLVEVFGLMKTLVNLEFNNSLYSDIILEMAIIETCTVKASAESFGSNKAETQTSKVKDVAPVSRRVAGPPDRLSVAPSNITSATSSKERVKQKVDSAGGIIDREPISKDDASVESSDLDIHWNRLLQSLRQTGNRFNIGALLRGCHERKLEEDRVFFMFRYGSHVERMKSELSDPNVKKGLEDALESVLGKKMGVEIKLADDDSVRRSKPVSQRSHLVRAAQAMGARIIQEKEKSR